MCKKHAGWAIIGIAIVIGILRLLNVIDNAVTAVLFMGAVVVLGGASKKKKQESPESEE
jgi:uncharacterized membrane protein HdeD (DUF308 family)